VSKPPELGSFNDHRKVGRIIRKGWLCCAGISSLSNSQIEREVGMYPLIQINVHSSIGGRILAGGSSHRLQPVLPTPNEEPSQ